MNSTFHILGKGQGAGGRGQGARGKGQGARGKGQGARGRMPRACTPGSGRPGPIRPQEMSKD